MLTRNSINNLQYYCKNKWFDSDTMKAWGSEIYDPVLSYNDQLFVFISSEYSPELYSRKRLYTIRVMKDGYVKNFSALQEYDTLQKAKYKLNKITLKDLE